MVNDSIPEVKTLLFDMSDGLPFDDNSIDVIIADLCLHYFDSATTNFIFKEIYRVLTHNGLLLARVNATSDLVKNSNNYKEIEKNFYCDGDIYKRFFDYKDFDKLFKGFDVLNLIQYNMSRYEKPKMLWEFCIRKKA